MAINPNKNLNDPSISSNDHNALSPPPAVHRLSQTISNVSSSILHSSSDQTTYMRELDQRLFQKLSSTELESQLNQAESTVTKTCLQSIDYLLDRIDEKDKASTSMTQIQFIDIDQAIINAEKQLKEVKGKCFPELQEKEQVVLSDVLQSTELILDFVETSQAVQQKGATASSLESLKIDELCLGKSETIKTGTRVTQDIVSSLTDVRQQLPLTAEEAELCSSKVFQLKDAANICLYNFSHLAAFTTACQLFLKETREAFYLREKAEQEVKAQKPSSCCQHIREMLLFLQRKLIQFGKFLRSLFVQLFSKLATSCSSACMAPLVVLRRKKAKEELAFVERIFTEGKMTFGSSSITILGRLKLFLKLFGLDLLVITEEGNSIYQVVIDISEEALENKDSLSNIMLALVKYFENFSFETLLDDIDGLPDQQARDVERILASRIDELLSTDSWLFFKNLRDSK